LSTTLAAALLASTVRLVAAHGYPDGAPPGFSGGFKEDTCHACHFHEEPNAAPGGVAIDGVPPAFTPGQSYTLTVRLSRAGTTLAGFQLAVRFKDGGVQAGSLAPGPADGDRVDVEAQSGVQYAGQTKAGAAMEAAVGTADAAQWTIIWTAPTEGRPVIFHVSANAADGNGSAEGDFVYSATAESAPP
jgi:hypothetical protein